MPPSVSAAVEDHWLSLTSDLSYFKNHFTSDLTCQKTAVKWLFSRSRQTLDLSVFDQTLASSATELIFSQFVS